MRTFAYKGDVGRIEKSIIKSARTKWMAPNKCKAMSCTIVLAYAIIMIIKTYSIIPIYLQVSKTERLAELH